MNRIFTLTLPAASVLAGALALASPASADIRSSCKKDVDQLCKSVTPGKGKLLGCLAENRAKVSDSCKIAIADTMLERRAKKDGKNNDDE